jgi:hypothetical protein
VAGRVLDVLLFLWAAVHTLALGPVSALLSVSLSSLVRRYDVAKSIGLVFSLIISEQQVDMCN